MENEKDVDVYEVVVERDFKEECEAMHGRIQLYLGQWRQLCSRNEQHGEQYEKRYQTDTNPEGSSKILLMKSASPEHIDITVSSVRVPDQLVQHELTIPNLLQSTYIDHEEKNVIVSESYDESEYERLYELAWALFEGADREADQTQNVTPSE